MRSLWLACALGVFTHAGAVAPLAENGAATVTPPFVLSRELKAPSRTRYTIRERVETRTGPDATSLVVMSRTCEEKIAATNSDGYVVHWDLGSPKLEEGDPKAPVFEAATIAGKLNRLAANVYVDGRPATLDLKPIGELMSKASQKAMREIESRTRAKAGAKFEPIAGTEEVNRIMTFTVHLTSFVEMFYRRPGVELEIGAPKLVALERRFGSIESIATKSTFERTATSDDAVTLRCTSQLDPEAITRMLQELEAPAPDSSGVEDRLRRQQVDLLKRARELGEQLTQSTTYTLDAKTGWPLKIEHKDAILDDDELHLVELSVEKLQSPASK